MKTESFSKSLAAEIAGLGFALEIAVALIILAMVFSAAPSVGSMVCVAAEINTSSDWAASDYRLVLASGGTAQRLSP